MRKLWQRLRAVWNTLTRARRRCPSLKVEPLECRQVLSVTYGGGPLLHNVQIETVFYGQPWTTDANLQQTITQTDSFLQYLVTSPYFDLLKQYNVGDGAFVNDDVIDQNPSGGQTMTDSQIEQVLQTEINAQRVPAPGPNQMYVFFTAPNVVVTDDGQNSVDDFAGYHDVFTDTAVQPVYYAVIPYPSGGIAEINLSDFQQETMPLSHEVAETVTDPDTETGWLDPQGNEIADLANNQFGTLNGYVVSGLWSNAAGQVVFPTATTGVNLAPAGVQLEEGTGLSFTDVVATFTATDPSATASSYTALIDWGDNTTSNGTIVADPSGGFDVLGSHTYDSSSGSGSGLKNPNPGHSQQGSGEGTFDLTVGIQDATDNSAATANSVADVTATPPPLSAAGQNLSVTAGNAFSGTVATFTNSAGSAAGSFSAAISWGDGTVTTGAITANAAGGYNVNGTHTYNTSGTYTVFVKIQDTAGDSVVGLGTATVAVNGYYSVAMGFLQSNEYDTDLIVADYQQYLSRTPSSSETAYWVGLMQQGWTDNQIAAGFLSSPEFFGDAGNTNTTWVDALYHDLLGRTADAGGEAYWLQQLANGVSRTDVALGFATSQERTNDLVQSYYQQYLGRMGNASEIAYWVSDLQQARTDRQVQAGIVSSPEFYGRAGNTDKAWVDTLYLKLLDRPADGAGENYWLQILVAAGQ